MADTRLWHNGRVFTGDRYAEAILVDAGRVVAVGSHREVHRDAPTGTDSVDLGGHLVIPGLIDAHIHLGRVTLARESLDVSAATTIPELVDLARAWAGEHPQGTVVAYGWRAGQFPGEAEPRSADLDRAVEGRGFVLYHASGHAAVVNRPALEAMGIGRTTVEPIGGRIGRATNGEPDGALYESALRPVEQLLSETVVLEPTALGATLSRAASLGITTAANMNVGRREATTFAGLRARGSLPIRVRLYLHLDAIPLVTSLGIGRVGSDDFLAITGVKAFTDGAFGPRTAWLSQPYADDRGEYGLPAGNDADLADALQDAASLGLAPALHAIGDRAIERSLELLWELPPTAAPPRIEHASLTPPELLPRIDEVRPALVVQPGFVWSDHWLAERLGRDRARWAYAFRTLADRGHLLAGSSDAPYDPIDPWRGVQAAVWRRDPAGRSANPETAEAVPVEEALGMYTANGGRAIGEPALGRLAPGDPADLLVLDASDLASAVRRGAAGIREVRVAGAAVYRTSGDTASDG